VNEANTAIMMAAAAVIVRPVRLTPAATAVALSLVCCQASWMRATRKTS
jgi:2-methylcitrate dehydratase PrpD